MPPKGKRTGNLPLLILVVVAVAVVVLVVVVVNYVFLKSSVVGSLTRAHRWQAGTWVFMPSR